MTHSDPNRRRFLTRSGATAVGVGTLAHMMVPRMVHAGANEQLKVGLIGCGGRGTGAASDTLHGDPQAVLTAVGDTFYDHAQMCLKGLKVEPGIGDRVQVDDDHVFSGFDAYQKVIDSGVDVVLLTTAPHFRPQHLRYAVQAGKHCFVEKPIAVDAPGVRDVDETCRVASEKGLAIVSGLCWRYHPAVRETIDRIHRGDIGEIRAIESQYNAGTLWHRGDKANWSRMEYQIRNWLYYTWLSGDHIVEQAIHSLDKTSWLLGDATPVRAVGMGGRQQRGVDAGEKGHEKWGNIFDHHTVFYEYANGVKVFFTCRQQAECATNVDEQVIGTQGTARVLKHEIRGANAWKYDGEDHNMYRLEHAAMYRSIRDGAPINNGKYMVNSTMIAIMGRMCTYTGKDLTWKQCWDSQERLGPTEYAWGDVPEQVVAIPGRSKFA
jgi:predicted dehydrogenase